MGNIIDAIVPELDGAGTTSVNCLNDEIEFESSEENESKSIGESEFDSDEKSVKRKPKPLSLMRKFADIGVTVTFNKIDAQDIHNCDIQRCSTKDRNDLVEAMISKHKGNFSTDIFQLTPRSKWREKAKVSVGVSRNLLKGHKVTAWVRMNGKWLPTEVKVQATGVEFNTNLTDVEYFVIMSSLETKTFSIPPRGTNIRVDDTSKLELSIPKGAVDTDQNITVQILPPDRNARKKYAEGKKDAGTSIVELTDCLYTNNINLKTPVTVKLPFEKTPAETEETTLVAFQMDQQKEVHMMEPNVKVTMDKGVAQLEVQQLSGCCAALVKSKCLNDRPRLEREAEIMFGTRSLATILLLKDRSESKTGYPKLWIELVDKSRVAEVLTIRNEAGLLEITNSRSQDISIFDGFRLRIDITGGLQGVQRIPKNYYLITYMEMARDHHISFHVIKPKVCSTSWCTLSFLSDKGKRNCVHEIDLENTDINFKTAKRKDGLTIGPKVGRVSKRVEKDSIRNDPKTL